MVIPLLLVSVLLVFSGLFIVSGRLLGWVSLKSGFGLGFLILSSVLGVVVGRWEARFSSCLDNEEVLSLLLMLLSLLIRLTGVF